MRIRIPTALKEDIKCSWRYCVHNHVHTHQVFHFNSEIHMNPRFPIKNILYLSIS